MDHFKTKETDIYFGNDWGLFVDIENNYNTTKNINIEESNKINILTPNKPLKQNNKIKLYETIVDEYDYYMENYKKTKKKFNKNSINKIK
jgi:hypothetical protein